jgi:two-component system, OmpR family, sensor histidine kinase MprB
VNLRTRFALTTALVGATVALAAAFGGQVVVARQLRQEIDQGLLRRGARIENPGGTSGGPGPGARAGTNGSTAPDRGITGQPSQTNQPDQDSQVSDGSGRGRRRGASIPNLGSEGRVLTPAELRSLALSRRCLNGRRGDAVILAQFIARDGTIEQCLLGQAFPVDAADKILAKSAAGASDLVPRLRTVTVAGERYRMATIAGPVGASQWVRELAGESAVLQRLRRQFVLLGLGATLLAALAGWLLAGRFLRPVQKLRSATDKIAETQNLTELVDASGRDEIASLGRSFNSMIAALSTSREQQQRLILDASHELRTPLTSLRTNIEMANRPRRLSDDDNREVMTAALAEVQELTNVISELVELATDRTADEPLVSLRLVDLANDVAERTRRRTNRVIEIVAASDATSSAISKVNASVTAKVTANVASKAISGTVSDVTTKASLFPSADPPIGTTSPKTPTDAQSSTKTLLDVESVMGRPRMLERAIVNLVENAIKYSTPGTPVTVEVSQLAVTVIDQGPGIDPKDLPYIFDRFYRSDQARSAQGSGLGLAIVRQIVERHGGEVTATNTPRGGAAVGFRLAKNP